jgi:hypothetical protein
VDGSSGSRPKTKSPRGLSKGVRGRWRRTRGSPKRKRSVLCAAAKRWRRPRRYARLLGPLGKLATTKAMAAPRTSSSHNDFWRQAYNKPVIHFAGEAGSSSPLPLGELCGAMRGGGGGTGGGGPVARARVPRSSPESSPLPPSTPSSASL